MQTKRIAKIVPIHKGVYSPTEQYLLNDIVTYNSDAYWHYADQVTVGVDPTDTTVWRLLVSGGGGGGGAVDSVNGQTGDVVLDADDVGAIAAPASPTAGQFLVWDGVAWVPQTLTNYAGEVV